MTGWNDLGMHCFDGRDYSVFAVLPPYNTIHVHLIDSTGKLVISPTGYTVTYQAVNDPLTNTLNTSSILKTNFWQYASALGFGVLAPDTGLDRRRYPADSVCGLSHRAVSGQLLPDDAADGQELVRNRAGHNRYRAAHLRRNVLCHLPRFDLDVIGRPAIRRLGQ
jgi:hypothetical protein